MESNMFCVLSCFVVLLLSVGSKARASEGGDDCPMTKKVASLGALFDCSSRVGKQQKVAIDLALQDLNNVKCSEQLVLERTDSHGNSARGISAAIDLNDRKKVQAIIGTLTIQEAILMSEMGKTTKVSPILSLTSSAVLPPTVPLQPSFFIQMANDVTLHIRCIAAIVGHFKWRKVTTIYENNVFSAELEKVTLLSDSLRAVGSGIEHLSILPCLSSASDPERTIEEELKKLRSEGNRVFIVAESSLEFAIPLFQKASQMGMMEKGYVWIVGNEIASLLDSVDSSVIYNMQGVIGFKTRFESSGEAFRGFKSKFQKKYGSEYPEEEIAKPSIFALRAYDATWAVGQAIKNSRGRITPRKLSQKILSTNFEGLSGTIIFKNGALTQPPVFQIINVIGKSYREVTFWSPELGFSENFTEHVSMKERASNGSAGVLGPIYWPGGQQTVPKGLPDSVGNRPLRIGVPAAAAFSQFVSVTYDNHTKCRSVTGFSIDVFEAALQQLHHGLEYDYVPFNGSYDDLVKKVHDNTFDAAVGDIETMAYRLQYADFTLPYVESGLTMVAPVTDNLNHKWLFVSVFTPKMWLIITLMHLFVGFVIWLTENDINPEIKGIGDMIWFCVTILFFVHREPVKKHLSRLVLAPWLLMILIVVASFTASLSSRMTASRFKPSVLDIETLQKTNAKVGCNKNSFIVKYLINNLKFKPENIKRVEYINDYPEAFQRGEIKSAFFTAPHASLFVKKYCQGYAKVGTIVNLGGLGFAFPRRSPMVSSFSKAILEVTQSGKKTQLEASMLSSSNCSSASLNDDEQQLGPEPFYGLIFILGGVSLFAFLVSLVRLVRQYQLTSRVCTWARKFLTQIHQKFPSLRRS